MFVGSLDEGQAQAEWSFNHSNKETDVFGSCMIHEDITSMQTRSYSTGYDVHSVLVGPNCKG